MIYVRSSVIKVLAYNEILKTLIIYFENGTHYKYKHVPIHVYNQFLVAKSKGSFYNDYIKGHFDVTH